MARPKDIGTQCETAVANYLVSMGFADAERRSLKGNKDCGDITGVPGICIEVKGGKAAESASDNQIESWLDETEIERVNARVPFAVLVVKRKGVGLGNAGRWWACERTVVPWGRISLRWYFEEYVRAYKSLRNPEVEE